MGSFVGDQNTFGQGDPVELAPSAARGANGAGAAVAVGTAHTARLTLNVTAVGGTTPSLTVSVQTSSDGTNWRALASYAAATGTGPQRLSVSGLDRFLRVSWAITGTTPSFTFNVAGELV